MFDRHIFDANIFDVSGELLKLYSKHMDYINNKAEELEHTTGRPTFACTKFTLRDEIYDLQLLLPTSSGTLQANMFYYPTDYKSYLADLILE